MKTTELETAKVLCFNQLIEYAEGAIVSKNVLKKETGNVSLFSFDKDQGLSEHIAPFDALVQIIDGKTSISIGKENFELSKGEAIIMPAGIPHALHAIERFKMILTMIRA